MYFNLKLAFEEQLENIWKKKPPDVKEQLENILKRKPPDDACGLLVATIKEPEEASV